MLKYVVGMAVAAILIGGYYLSTRNTAPEPQESMHAESAARPNIVPIEHATGILRWDGAAIYFDPVGDPSAFAGLPPATIVLVTDIHGDHLSTSTLATITGSAKLIAPEAVYDMLPAGLKAKATVLANGASLSERGFRIEATPMYNLPTAQNKDHHPRGRGNGYLIEKDGVRVYIAGDTAGTPEMRALRDIDIAFVPMNLPYTMSVDEAASAVLDFKPKQVYPYHYRQPDGFADVEKFRQLVTARDPNIEVVLASWYPPE